MSDTPQLIAAAAILAIGGGILFSGALGSPEVVSNPATTAPRSIPGVAALDPGKHPPREVSGTLRHGLEDLHFEAVEVRPGIFEWTTPPGAITWRSDDPRLTGVGSVIEHGVQHPSSAVGLRGWRWTIENDEGTWVGASRSFAFPEHDDPGAGWIIFEGTDGYAGLSAYLELSTEGAGSVEGLERFTGVIFPSSFPEPPTVAGSD